MPIYEGIGLVNEKQPVVIEIGHSYTKIGFAGENCPKAILPTDELVTPIPASAAKESSSQTRVRLISKYLVACSPEEENDLYGLLVQFFYNIYFKHLLVTPKDRRIVIVESLLTNSTWRRVLAKVLFMHFEVLNILFMPAQLSAVAAIGTDTALVVDVGHLEAVVVPVIAGVTLLSQVNCQELGSMRIDERLRDLLVENCVTSKVDKEELGQVLADSGIIEDVRVRCCFVVGKNKGDKIDELNMKPFQYKTKQGYSLEFKGVVRGSAAEVWFNNSDLDGESLPLMILDTLAKCPIDTRRILAKSIVLTGGSTMIPGFQARLLRELKSVSTSLTSRYETKFNDDYEFRIFKAPCAENSLNWIGGSLYGTNQVIILRGVSKEYFLKYGVIPDWSDWIKTSALPPVAPQLILS